MTITLTREEAQKVLEGLENIAKSDWRKWEELADPKEFERWVKARANHMAETLRARLAQPEPSVFEDAIVYGTGITKGGKRIDPSSIYKEPEPSVEPVAWADMNVRGEDKGLSWTPGYFHTQPLYTAPPQAEPEPVAWQGVHDQTDLYYRKPLQADVRPLYTAPPQREWQGLTDEEITALKRNGERYISSQEFARAIEAKLKEKNT